MALVVQIKLVSRYVLVVLRRDGFEQLRVVLTYKQEVVELPYMVSQRVTRPNGRSGIAEEKEEDVTSVGPDKSKVVENGPADELGVLDPLRVVQQNLPDLKGTVVAAVDQTMDEPEEVDLLVVNQEEGPDPEG